MSNTEAMLEAAARTGPRDFTSILVHAEPELEASHRVEVAARLARDHQALLIGVGAEALDLAGLIDPVGVTAGAAAQAEAEIAARFIRAEEAFRRDAAGVETEWRIERTDPAQALARLSRAADLIVVAALDRKESDYRRANAADVVMAAGRPVLIVPRDGRHLRGASVVVGWKDNRETRRAVADAMPFLLRAEQVIVHAVCTDDDLESVMFQANDVAQALKRHGVAVRAEATRAPADEVTGELDRIAHINGADLLVAGAYGRSRLAEWAFGGVTDDLLHRPSRFVLTSR